MNGTVLSHGQRYLKYVFVFDETMAKKPTLSEMLPVNCTPHHLLSRYYNKQTLRQA